MDKIVESAQRAVADVKDGSTVAVGGFGPAGVPVTLVAALLKSGAGRLHVVTNNVGDGWGLGQLLEAGRLSKVTMSYMGQNKRLAAAWLDGSVEIEFTPQGTMVERLRAAGAGVPAFYTPTGVGTLVSGGGLPLTFRDGHPSRLSEAKEVRTFDGQEFVLERALRCDVALVHCHRADRYGNLTFRAAARNFNPIMAMAADVTIAEAEQIVPVGDLDPDGVHVPAAYVTRVLGNAPANTRVDVRTTSGGSQ